LASSGKNPEGSAPGPAFEYLHPHLTTALRDHRRLMGNYATMITGFPPFAVDALTRAFPRARLKSAVLADFGLPLPEGL